VVFVGPTLSADEVSRQYPTAQIRPPAAIGDLLSCLRTEQPHAIGIIDAATWPDTGVGVREVLEALRCGVWVLGSSAVGAFRAVECEPYGAIGIGEIADLVRAGQVTDDEVIVAHAGHHGGFEPRSEALVNLRDTVWGAASAGILTPPEGRALLGALQARDFMVRSRATLVEIAVREIGMPAWRAEALESYLLEEARDVLAEDARLLLAAMADLPDGPVPVDVRPSRVDSPTYLTLEQRDRAVQTSSGAPVPLDAVMRFSALNDPRHHSVRRSAARKTALVVIAEALGITPTEAALREARAIVAERLGASAEELAEWAATVDLAESDLDRLVSEEALTRLLEQWAMSARGRCGLVPAYLDELRLEGTYRDLRDLAGEAEAAAASSVRGPDPIGANEAVDRHVARGNWVPPRHWTRFIEDSDLGDAGEVYERLVTYLTAAAQGASLAAPRTPAGPLADDGATPRRGVPDPTAPPTRSRGF
jgi:hypothetical protein